jgi:hypothetical protein
MVISRVECIHVAITIIKVIIFLWMQSREETAGWLVGWRERRAKNKEESYEKRQRKKKKNYAIYVERVVQNAVSRIESW